MMMASYAAQFAAHLTRIFFASILCTGEAIVSSTVGNNAPDFRGGMLVALWHPYVGFAMICCCLTPYVRPDMPAVGVKA